MGGIINLDSSTIIKTLDYLVIAIFAISVISGFVKGMFKTTYNLIVFIGLMLLGWFLMPAIIEFLLDYNFSSFNLSINGSALTTIRETLPVIVGSMDATIGSLMVEGTETYNLVFALAFSAFRLILMLVWLILTLTVFKFVFWIIYLIIRPRRKDAQGNIKKKSFASRFGGAVMGGAFAFIITVLVAIPFAGLTSIGNSFGAIAGNETEVSYHFKAATTNGYLFLEEEPEDPLAEFQEVFNFMSQFRGDSLLGQIGGIGGSEDGEKSSIDEALFDQLLEFKYGDVQVELRQEIKTMASAYVQIYNATGGIINMNTISNLDTAVLDSVLGKISELQILNVIAPVAIEYVGNNEDIIGELSEAGLSQEDIAQIIEDVKKIDIAAEIGTIASAVVDLGKSGLFDEQPEGEENNIFTTLLNADSAMLGSAMDKLGGLGISDMIGSFGANAVLNGPIFEQIFTQFGISKEDINLDGIDWGSEIANLGGIIDALQEMGLVIKEDGSIDFSDLSTEGISAFVDELFKSTLLGNNTKLIVATVKQALPEEVQDFIQVDDLTSEDFKAILEVGSTVASYIDEETGQVDFEGLLKSDAAEKLGEAIENSDAMAKTIEDTMGKILENVGIGINFDDFDITGIDWSKEVVALGAIMSSLEKYGLKFGSESVSFNINDFTTAEIEDMVDTLFTSQILSKNTRVLMQAIKDMVPSAYKDQVEVKTMTAAEVKAILNNLRS
ncbi:MAG: hypothetical protein PHY83_03825 [Bacilli bacterium]|nr:hypothetical protein [Bacilli bacterium]